MDSTAFCILIDLNMVGGFIVYVFDYNGEKLREFA